MAGPYVAQVAKSTPFDTSTNGFPTDNISVQDALENDKAGTVVSVSFSGNPKKATITFVNPFPDTNYAIIINSTKDGRAWLYESKTVNGFVINTQANAPITDEVSWIASRNRG